MTADKERIIYLLCFAHQPFGHAKHYLGSTNNLERRLDEHRGGKSRKRGSRLMAHVQQAGIDFVLARTWQGDRRRERQLKARGHSRHCPICTPSLQNRKTREN